ncbi:MAG: nitrilase-related carbon-nitrogen hydrolase, partial [Bacillus sp. (in: firmicutes)]
MTLAISIIQMDISFGDPQTNFEIAEQKIKEACQQKTDIIVLPELWTTGYDLTRLNEISDKSAQKTISFLQKMAMDYHVHLVGGSIANQKENGIYNTLIIINKHGELVHT